MSDRSERAQSSDIAVGSQRRSSRALTSHALVGASWGFVVAAVGLSVYGFVQRVPVGLVSDRLGSATRVLGGSLGVVVVAAVVLSSGGVAVLTGRAVAKKAAWALTITAAITSFMFLSSLLRQGAEAVSGPGARPVVALAQVSWLLLSVAAVLLVAGAVVAQEQTRRAVKWPALLGFVAIGVVVALVAGSGVVALAQRGEPRAVTAAVIAVPELPAAVGADTAYTVAAEHVDWLVPAGPGFVLVGDGALTAYNGADGRQRWRFPLESFPAGCSLTSIRSTGTSADAVVIAQCHHEAANLREPRTDPFLVGLDAMTGQLLWTVGKDWSVRSRLLLPADVVPVVDSERNELGSLDPRTGAVRWTWPFSEADEKCSDTGYVGALEGHVMYAVPCGPLLRVYVFDAVSGAHRVIDGPVPQEFSDGEWTVEPHAVDVSVAVVRILQVVGNGSAVLSIDTAGGQVEVLPVKYLSNGDSVRAGQYPGPILQTDRGSEPEPWLDLYRLSDRSTVRAVGLETFSGGSYAPRTSVMWAEVGTAMVSADAYDREFTKLLVSVARDGTVTRRPSPCGDDIGGVMAVPGAVLVVCQRADGARTVGYDILGLR